MCVTVQPQLLYPGSDGGAGIRQGPGLPPPSQAEQEAADPAEC